MDWLRFHPAPDVAVTTDPNQQKRRHQWPQESPVSVVVGNNRSKDRTQKQADAGTEKHKVQSLFHEGSMQVTLVVEQ
jgi:hypothetical protein